MPKRLAGGYPAALPERAENDRLSRGLDVGWGSGMNLFPGLILWLILLVVCWPLALLALILYPLVWLVLLPFRLVGISVDAVFELLGAILRLPARLLRGPRSA